MRWNGIRVPVVVLALVLGLAAFWGSQWLYGRLNYERPLARFLGENKYVAAYSINNRGPVMELEVKLGKVDNLQETYNSLQRSVQDIVGRRNFKIILKDERDKSLEDLHHYSRLAAFEAMERGNFLEMEEYISRRAAREGASAKILMDQDRLYIQLVRGSYYLYDIIPRNKMTGDILVGVEGGSPS